MNTQLAAEFDPQPPGSVRVRPEPVWPRLSSWVAGGRGAARESKERRPRWLHRRCNRARREGARDLRSLASGPERRRAQRAPRPAEIARHHAHRQFGTDDGSVRQRSALGSRPWRDHDTLRADDGSLRRSPRARRQVARARGRGALRARRTRAARVRRRPSLGGREPSGFCQRRARGVLRDDARRGNSASTPATPSRSPRRRSISPAGSRRTCGTSI